jgi:prepilin-type N-terminal cleavage/methylation domain-containing protein
MQTRRFFSDGFTVVELVIVILVIGILAGLGFVGYNNIKISAQDKSLISDIDAVESEITRSATKNGGTYGPSLSWQSDTGTNPNINITPTKNNIIVVNPRGTSYCIRAYNPSSSTNKTLQTALKKGDCTTVWTQLSAGATFTCGLASDNTGRCWGGNSFGQLGNKSNTNTKLSNTAIWTAGVLGGQTLRILAAGYQNACTVALDNKPYCWGQGGMNGDGTSSDTNVPVAVSTSGVLAGRAAKALAFGSDVGCVIASGDAPYCWGQNSVGQLGNGTTGGSNSTPTAVVMSGVLAGKITKAVSTKGASVCVIASDDNAYCWGNNQNGQLGNNSASAFANAPVAVATSGVLSGKTIKTISVGISHACAIASDDQAYCWGSNASGQLGNGTTTSSSVPVAVNKSGALAGKSIVSISAGSNHTCAIASDNQAYCWGWNAYGMLGNNTTANTTVPQAVTASGVLTGKKITGISAGTFHSCALASDNTAFCWGYNGYGQLGNGSTTSSLVPVAVTPLPDL